MTRETFRRLGVFEAQLEAELDSGEVWYLPNPTPATGRFYSPEGMLRRVSEVGTIDTERWRRRE